MMYEMEELIPVVGKLAEKYTAFESTSVTYEKAEQLMGAVLYCIQETGSAGGALAKKTSAGQAYEAGFEMVKRKVKDALDLYNGMMQEFESYGNPFLEEVFIKGLPEFFKWYDAEFEPQNTILTLDYPVLRSLTEYAGIDRIYEYEKCILQEQRFLAEFPKEYVQDVYCRYYGQQSDVPENICEPLLAVMAAHILIKKPFQAQRMESRDYENLRAVLLHHDLQRMQQLAEDALDAFVQNAAGSRQRQKDTADSGRMQKYLASAAGSVLVRLKSAAEHGSLCHII